MLRFSSYDIVFQEIPEETTLAINLTNCPNRCKGCHSPHLQEDVGEPLTEEVLSKLLSKYASGITCLCLMGGDSEPSEVERLAFWIHTQRQVKIGWYSGKSVLPPLLSLQPFQFIKMGPYIKKFGPLSCRTTNQRLYRVEGDGLIDVTHFFWI